MKIDMLQYVADENVLLQYKADGKIETIPFSAIREYWEYATSECFEGGSAYVCGSHIIGFITVASGQGGVVFVWNVFTHKIEHISEGAYTISVLLHDGQVYNLCCVENYITPAHFVLGRINLGTKDAYKEATIVPFTCAFSIDEYNGKLDSIELAVDEGILILSANGQRYPVRIE